MALLYGSAKIGAASGDPEDCIFDIDGVRYDFSELKGTTIEATGVKPADKFPQFDYSFTFCGTHNCGGAQASACGALSMSRPDDPGTSCPFSPKHVTNTRIRGRIRGRD